jgi:hypothetical protein
MAELIGLGLPSGALSYVQNLADSLGIESFEDRNTIGVLQTTNTGGSYYIFGSERSAQDFFEYYALPNENVTNFIERINDQQLEESNAKICYLKEDEIKTYFTIESDDFSMRGPVGGFRVYSGIMVMDYTPQQMDFLEQTYGDTEPELQLNLQVEQTPSSIGFQNTIENSEISYDSISSLGNVTVENFTVSATTGSTTGLIIEQSETITDVGGTVARGRRNEAGEIISVGGGAGSGRTVRTSGY